MISVYDKTMISGRTVDPAIFFERVNGIYLI